MKVLVAYASAHGSTKGIAEEIGRYLTRPGLDVDVRPVEAVDSLDPFGAVVLGSAIHDMAWLPQAATFVRARARDLASRPVWLFSVSSVGETSSFFGPRVAGVMRRLRKEPRWIARIRRDVAPRDHRDFAGAVDRSHWSLSGHLFLTALGGAYGDHRDWQDIDDWSDGIARLLTAAPDTAPGRASGTSPVV